MIPCDYHIHTNFSVDSRASMADMCRAATTKGIPEIGFAEHYDLHEDEIRHDCFQIEPWSAELQRCRAEFRGRLTIRAGIEIGEPHLFATEAQAILGLFPFDYALGSLHWVGREHIFDPSYFLSRSPDEAFQLYFSELERMTRVGGFDILSHFDVPVRTGHAIYGGYDPVRYEAAIRPVLRNCIERGIALDINTAALRRQARVLTPGIDILRWYVDMGGERVTLGSDAHRAEHVAAHLDVALEAARAAGLKYLTHFDQRQPRLTPLP
jgi:histidinol-phosphatase (PHP family)